MIKFNYVTLLALLLSVGLTAQSDPFWSATGTTGVKPSKNTTRTNFPDKFLAFSLDLDQLKTTLAQAPKRIISQRQQGVAITVPTADGNLETFRVLEASNFTDGLQARFPQIRSYVGQSTTDPNGILRLSISPAGVSGMILRAGTGSEFIEAYSDEQPVYAVFRSQRDRNALPLVCTTEERNLASEIQPQAQNRAALNNEGDYMTFRLALSCNGEYAVYFGGTVEAALAAMNATMTRVNGVYEKDLSVHLTMIDNTDDVIYTSAATDPYSTNMNNWNDELQETLTAVIGEANYDIGHMFGSTGGGGNAGCIGCVCVNNQKGSGITSPSDGNPQGDYFDIDYVAHEMGHQLGGTHTYSYYNEGSGTNVEPGSGSTIMGYAGIVPGLNVQAHSDDYFSYVTVNQIESNLANKTCPTREEIAGSAPVVEAGVDYILPMSTAFVLTATGSDPDGDAITYCWEQSDNVTSSSDDTDSECDPAKEEGPNFRSYDPVAVPYRFFPRFQSVYNNNLTTTTSGFVSEAVSSVARELNFNVTVRDGAAGVGRTTMDGMTATVTTSAGPFLVTYPNTTGISFPIGSNQVVTWDVAGTTANGVNTPYVDIYLSIGATNPFAVLLASQVPNDGSETITVPANVGTANRIMVKGNNHVFFDISNSNFAIPAAGSNMSVAFPGVAGEQNKAVCQGQSVSYTIAYNPVGGFSGTTTFSVAGLPTGATATFSPESISAAGNVTLTVTTTASSEIQLHGLTVTATSGSDTRTVPFYLNVLGGNFVSTSLTSPANNATAQSVSPVLTWVADPAATAYDVQIATDAAFNNVVLNAEASTNSYSASGLSEATTYYWRITPKNLACSGSVSEAFNFQTGQTVCAETASTDVPKAISSSGTPTVTSTLTIGAGTPISRVTVYANITHTWVSDLTVKLTSPAGTQITLIQNPCEDQNNMTQVTFDDNGGTPLCATNPAVTGLIKPTDLLATFNGENPEGVWTLTVSDAFQGDGGSITAWRVNICNEQPLGVADLHLQDLIVYPNPNNGSFNVSFTPATNDKVKISVHDIRGRRIFENAYEANGLFNENLNLNRPASGIYLVQIENGNVRETRKIVVE